MAPRLIERSDRAIDAAIDRIRSPFANRFFYTASRFGDHSMIWFAIAIILGLVRGDWYVSLRAIAAIPVESFIVNIVIKSFFRRGRPIHEGERPHFLRVPRTSSFPSGHATSGSVASILLSYGMAWEWSVLLYLAAAIIASSRVYVRIHHASDVVAGVIFGVALGLVGRAILF